MKNEKQQTAVELLWTSIMQNPFSSFEDGVKAYQQAKEMHKEEMVMFVLNVMGKYRNDDVLAEIAEQYYNETYGGNK